MPHLYLRNAAAPCQLMCAKIERLDFSKVAQPFFFFLFSPLFRLSCVRSIECLSDTTCTACGPLHSLLSRVKLCVSVSACVFQRLVEVKLLSAAGRRERADERPLHHPNGIHKTLNQRRSHCFGWVKPKKETKTRKRNEWEVAPSSREGGREGGRHTHTQTL